MEDKVYMDAKETGADVKVTSRQISPNVWMAELTGEIDVYTSPKIKEGITELIEKGVYNLIISLEGVRYIDSTGLGVLIGALKKVREHNGTIGIVCNNPQIKKIFSITGLVKIFGIYRDEQEALKSLA